MPEHIPEAPGESYEAGRDDATQSEAEKSWRRVAERCEHEKKLVEAERDMVRAALAELMSWVENWDPNFTDDDEWPGTKARVKTALGEER